VLKQTIPIEMNKTIHVVKNSENEKIDKEDDDEEHEHEHEHEHEDEDEDEDEDEHEHEDEHEDEDEEKKVNKEIKREISSLPKQRTNTPPRNILKSIKRIVVPNIKLHMKIFKTVRKIKRISETIKILNKRLNNTKIKSHKVKLQNVINSLDARKSKLKKYLTQIKVTKLK